METVFALAKEKMTKTVNALVHEYGTIRVGRANASVLDKVFVDYYGAPTPINQMAAISVSEARILTIQPWDKNGFSAVEKAILKSDLGLTPINDGKIIRIVIPALTEDRRKELVKVARKYAEEAKVAVRNVRRDANDSLKKMEKEKLLSEDERKKSEEDVQKLTDKSIAAIDKTTAAKEKEILEI